MAVRIPVSLLFRHGVTTITFINENRGAMVEYKVSNIDDAVKIP